MLDPDQGPIKKLVSDMTPGGQTVISVPPAVFESCPEGAVFNIQDDGNFEVPEDVAKFFAKQPEWHIGASPFPPAEMVAEYEATKKSRKKV